VGQSGQGLGRHFQAGGRFLVGADAAQEHAEQKAGMAEEDGERHAKVEQPPGRRPGADRAGDQVGQADGRRQVGQRQQAGAAAPLDVEQPPRRPTPRPRR
jgi:hypothetical protein